MSRHTPQVILVTGGAGFIGSHLVRRLLASFPDARVLNLDLLTYAGDLTRLEDLDNHPRLRFIHADVADQALLERVITEASVDTILHLAAESHVDRSIVAPGGFMHTNVMGTFALLEACRTAWASGSGWKPGTRLLHVSTDEVYGQLGPADPPFTEDSPYAPRSPYSASKAASDHLVRAYHQTYGLPVLVTNCSNNYGPAQHREKFIPTVIGACAEGRPIPLYGDGSNIRDWVYVEDHCEGLITALVRGRTGRTYAIGADCERSNLEVARTICGIMDELSPRDHAHADLISFVTDRPGHDWRYAIDCRRMHEELGWQPRESFESGLRRTATWYLERWHRAESAGSAPADMAGVRPHPGDAPPGADG